MREVDKQNNLIMTGILFSTAALIVFLLSLSNTKNRNRYIDEFRNSPNEISIRCNGVKILNFSARRLFKCNSALLIKGDSKNTQGKTIKFTIDPEDEKISGGIRAELRDRYEAKNGDEIWYRFSTHLPKEFPLTTPHRLVLNQWHEKTHRGVESLRPPISHRLWNGRFVVTLWNKEVVAKIGIDGDGDILYSKPQFKLGVYHEYIYRILWSPRKDGKITAWSRECPLLDKQCGNGSAWSEIIRYAGSTGYDEKDIEGYYFKFGLYTVNDILASFTVYHRNYISGPYAKDIGLNETLFK